MHSEFDEAKRRLRFWCIAQDWGSALAKLEVDLTPTDEGELAGVVRMNQRTLQWSYRFDCWGYDLAEFRKQVCVLHAGRRATAELTNVQGTFSMTLETVPSPQRTLQIAGLVNCISPDFTWKIPFGGFEGDASFLPDVATNIANFLTVTNVSIEHPMAVSR